MNITGYHKVSELTPLVKKLLSSPDPVRFIVPSRRDREWWLALAGKNEYGPCLPKWDGLWTWEDLYEDIRSFCEGKRRRTFSPPDHHLILKNVLAEILKSVPRFREVWPGLTRSSFIDILTQDVRELLNEDVSPNQLEAALVQKDELTTTLLPRLYRAYLEYLEENSLMDSSQICQAAQNLLMNRAKGWGSDFTLVFTGFLSFTHTQVKLIEFLGSQVRDVVILKPESDIEGFHDAHKQFPGALAQESKKAKTSFAASEPAHEHEKRKIVQLRSAEAVLEPELLARSLALWQEGRGPLAEAMDFPGFGALGLSFPEAKSAPLIDALNRYHIPFSLMEGPTVRETLPGRVLSSIRRLRNQGFPTRETAFLLSQPCFVGLALSLAPILKAGCRGLPDWLFYLERRAQQPLPEAEMALRAIKAIQNFLTVFGKDSSPALLMQSFREFLTTRGLWLDRMKELSLECPSLDEELRVTASAIETIKEKELGLRELLPDIGPFGKIPLKGEEAFDFLENWCQNSRVRPSLPLAETLSLWPGRPPVLAFYPVWIMTDVTQKNWPGRIVDSPLLGTHERDKLVLQEAHLLTLQEKTQQQEALFSRLVQTGESLTILSKAEMDEGEHPLSDSPFLRRFTEETLRWQFTDLLPRGLDLLVSGDRFLFSEIDSAPKERVERLRPEIRTELLPNLQAPFSLGVSALEDIITCPMRFWLQKQARLSEKNLDLATSAEWGNLAHQFWEIVWTQFQAERERPLQDFVAGEWDTLHRGKGPYEPYGQLIRDSRLRRDLEALRFRLFRLGDVQADILKHFHEKGFLYQESWVEEEASLAFQLDGQNIVFTGRCDRVDVLESPEGQRFAVIADYKNGRCDRYEKKIKSLKGAVWNIEGQQDFRFGLQLSSYALMFRTQHPDLPLKGVHLLSHREGKLAGTFQEDVLPFYQDHRTEAAAGTLDDRAEEAHRAMLAAAEILRLGRFYPLYDSPSCCFCGFKGICRKGEFLGETLSDDSPGGEEDE